MRQARPEDPVEIPVEPPVEPAPRPPHPGHRLLADIENEIERLLGKHRVGRLPALIAELRRSLP